KVRMPQASSSAIEFSATTSSPWTARTRLPLVALPEATEQQGRVLVRGAAAVNPAVDAVGLTTIPLPAAERSVTRGEDTGTIRSAFRFNPANCLKRTDDVQLWISPGGSDGATSLVARDLELESYYWPSGRATHRATFQLNNFGAAEFIPPLTPDAKI